MSVRNRILGPPVLKMPSGLVEIMDGLARDVLKNNPANVYEFCARHMQTLLEIRDGRVIRPLLTLDEKIEKAQKKVKQRAEQRQRAFDKMIADDVNKQVLPAHEEPCNSDSEGKTEKVLEDSDLMSAHALGKQEIVDGIEKQGLEQREELINSELKNETNEQKDDLNKHDHEDVKEHDNNYNSQNALIYNEEKHDLLDQGEFANNDNIKGIETEDNAETKPSEEIEPVAIASDVIKADDDNLNGSLTDKPTINIANSDNFQEKTISAADDDSLTAETTTKITITDNFEEKIISTTDNDINSHVEDTEIMHSDCGIKLEDKVETKIEDTNDDIRCMDTKETEALSLDDNPEDNSSIGMNTERFQKEINVPSTTNSLNDNDTKTILNNEAKNSTEKDDQNLNEPGESQDNKILTVILASHETANAPLPNSESVSVQPDKLNPVETIEPELNPKEFDLKSKQTIDSENSPKNYNKMNSMNSSMDLETAAITIQKVFRSFLFKTKTASYDDPTAVDITLLTEQKQKDENEMMNIKDRRPLGISRMDTVLQTVNEEKSLSLSTDDSSTLSSAATVIQAHVRGFLVRNKMNSNKTISSNSFIDSDAPSIPSLDADSENLKTKTILNIHIVPEGGHFISRDESILTSMDLSLDSSPPSSVNLHPLGYDKSERRKQLKREDAIQSVSPPSNNSGKLSEDHDSVKEVLPVENNSEMVVITLNDTTSAEPNYITETEDIIEGTENNLNTVTATTDAASDEMDVVTPFVEGRNSRESDNSSKLLHSGEFHDILVPTNVTRSDTSVVRGE